MLNVTMKSTFFELIRVTLALQRPMFSADENALIEKTFKNVLEHRRSANCKTEEGLHAGESEEERAARNVASFARISI